MPTRSLFTRKPLNVEAYQITEANIGDIAILSKTSVHVTPREGQNPPRLFIALTVKRFGKEKRIRAYTGDWLVWVVKGGKGFKVFHDDEFRDIFRPTISSNQKREEIKKLLAKASLEKADVSQDILRIFGEE